MKKFETIEITMRTYQEYTYLLHAVEQAQLVLFSSKDPAAHKAESILKEAIARIDEAASYREDGIDRAPEGVA